MNIKASLTHDTALHSNRESPFESFKDNLIEKTNLILYEDSFRLSINKKPSTGKLLFPKYYETFEENSCNAVDIHLPNTNMKYTELRSDRVSSKDDINFTELSFNGKINMYKNIPQIIDKVKVVLPELSESETICGNLPQPSIFSESFILKKYSNQKSPDLFEEDETETTAKPEQFPEKELNDNVSASITHGDTQQTSGFDSSFNKSYNCPTESSFADDVTSDVKIEKSRTQKLFYENCQREKELLRRMQKCLVGIPPPPSVTIPQIDLINTVLSKKNEILNFFNEDKNVISNAHCSTKSTNSIPSILKPSHSFDEMLSVPWNELKSVRQHGLNLNINKAAEMIECLVISVIDRFIGAETSSSYRSSPSSAKKRNARLKLLTQSPGNRLSHLAKRRAIFSSANLATTSQKQVGPQIIINQKKNKHRRKTTPKRMTSATKKNRQTPSLSARKRLFRCDVFPPGPSRESSKRALFQSPAKSFVKREIAPPKPIIKPEIANRVEKSKRALFSPDESLHGANTSISSYNGKLHGVNSMETNTTQFETLLKRKRNCFDDDDADTMELAVQNSKFLRTDNLTPRALKIKSQSFCIGAGSSSIRASANAACPNKNQMNACGRQLNQNGLSLGEGKMQRAHSDVVSQSNSLTENQRKKLLWAVSQALQEKKITTKHDKFKHFAAVLTRVVRRIFQEYYFKNSTSNSETMLRLAKKYVHEVIIDGKSVDLIYLQARTQIEESKRKLSLTKLSGYIGREEYQKLKNSQLSQPQSSRNGSSQSLFSLDNSIDDFSNNLKSSSYDSICTISQSSFLNLISQESKPSSAFCHAIENGKSTTNDSQHLSIQPNPSLNNSSSKSNLGGVALRENVDCEQRRSTHKNFTGKDQRNISPYSSSSSAYRLGSGKKVSTQLMSEVNMSYGLKAKRQISFDS